MIEYKIGGEAWRCDRFEDLQAEMENGLVLENMPVFHAMVSGSLNQFRIVRRIFGIALLSPPTDFNPNDYKVWPRAELAKELGITLPKITETLDGIRGMWKTTAKRLQPAEATAIPATVLDNKTPGSAEQFGELDFRSHPLLKKFNFAMKFKSIEEKENFASKVEAFERVLNEPLVSGIAVNALNTRFSLDRLLQQLSDESNYTANKKVYREDLILSQELGKTYDGAIEKILELCPWASQIAGKHALQPVISTITQCYLDYKKRGDTHLADGVFTAMGIKVELRMTKQMPQPRYRFGLVLAINAAKEGVLDPEYKNPFTQTELKKLDTAFRETLKAVSIAEGEGMVDLQSDDPVEGEFPDLIPGEKAA